jgi:threonylcarbamoyladenosine tRNA methylthiotransferase MtaB
MPPKRVGFYTLGCKLNFSETATLAQQFRERSFVPVPFDSPAEVYVINTCSVTEQADRKCRKAVRQALKHNPSAYVVVVGCYAQLKPHEIAQIPGVSAVLGAAEKFRLFDLLGTFEPTLQTQVHHCASREAREFVPTQSVEERTRAFLKVQDGCDYKCSFCTIPLARGASRSEHPEAVLARARGLVAQGVQEIVLTGINLGDYGAGQDYDLLELLDLLDTQLDGLPRLRLSSVEPNLLSDLLIERITTGQRLMPHVHLPLQSGSDRVLALMRRRYRAQLYADRLERLTTLMPHVAIGCDVIVGFPGETEADFDATCRFLADQPVTYLHVFPFSERQNTVAAALPGTVPQAVREERAEILRHLSDKKKQAFYARHLGQVREVLFEHTVTPEGLRAGYTDNYIRVWAPADRTAPNTVVPVTLAMLTPTGVLATPVNLPEVCPPVLVS